METRLHIYCMMVRSLLTYAAPAWQHAAAIDLLLLQRVQNRAARMITGHSRDTRISQLHEDLVLPYLSEFMTVITNSFWNRMRNSPIAPLRTIGTSQPPRHVYRMLHQPP